MKIKSKRSYNSLKLTMVLHGMMFLIISNVKYDINRLGKERGKIIFPDGKKILLSPDREKNLTRGNSLIPPLIHSGVTPQNFIYPQLVSNTRSGRGMRCDEAPIL